MVPNSARPASMGVNGNQAAREPRWQQSPAALSRPEPRGHGEEAQRQENRGESQQGRDKQVRPRGLWSRGNGCGWGPDNGLVWAGTGLMGLLAGERVKGHSPALTWQRPGCRAEESWDGCRRVPYQYGRLSCNRPASLAEEHFGLDAGRGGEAVPMRLGPGLQGWSLALRWWELLPTAHLPPSQALVCNTARS